jgi:hypothetical protein
MTSISSFSGLIEHYEETGKEELVTELECLKGSYSTLRYNHMEITMEYSDHMIHREEDVSELESGPLPAFQYKLHNYITSSYSFTENVDTALSRFDKSLKETYQSEFYGTPIEKPMRGLRIYAQHHRVLPLEIERVDAENEHPELFDRDFENLVVIDITGLVASKQDWDKKAQRHFFEVDKLDFINQDMELNAIEAVDAHFSLSNGLHNWILDKLAKNV